MSTNQAQDCGTSSDREVSGNDQPGSRTTGSGPWRAEDLDAEMLSAQGATVAERAESIDWSVNVLAHAEAVALGGQIIAGAARVARTTAAWVEMLGVFDARGGADQFEMDVAAWLAWACSMTPATARDHLRVARGLRKMPAIAAAFEAGELSYSKVRACSRIIGLIDDEVLLKRARDLTAAQLERAVAGFRAGRTERLVAEQRRSVSLQQQPDGSVRMSALLAPEEAALMRSALEMAKTRWRTEHARANAAAEAAGAQLTFTDQDVDLDDARTDAPKDSDPDEPAYTNADALVDIARGFIDAGPADASGEDRDLVVVHVSASDLHEALPDQPEAASTDTNAPNRVSAETPTDPPCADAETELGPLAGGSAWIEGVGAVHPSTAARIACTGFVQAVVIDETSGEVLYLGREQRLASKQQKRAMKARDKHCQFPSCQRAARLHAHHIMPWALGGVTDIDEMLLLCQHHHVVVHAAGITITKRKKRPGYDFRRSSGELLTAHYSGYYGGPGPMCGTLISNNDRVLLEKLLEDARDLDQTPDTVADPAPPGNWRVDSDPDWQLPDTTSDFADLTRLEDERASVLPRWRGTRVTGGDLWELMEEGAITERSNPNARY